MFEKLTVDQRCQIYEGLPENLREAILSVRTANIYWDLAGIYDVNEVSKFAGLIGDVLIGILPPQEFEDRLRKDLGLKPAISKALSQEIEELIFDPVQQSLDELNRMGISHSKVVSEVELKEEE